MMVLERGTRGETILSVYIGKILLKRNILSISMKLGINRSFMKGIQVYSNGDPSLLQRGDHNNAKVG
jgi:hypothetical protein